MAAIFKKVPIDILQKFYDSLNNKYNKHNSMVFILIFSKYEILKEMLKKYCDFNNMKNTSI